jgi:hypothetical protein
VQTILEGYSKGVQVWLGDAKPCSWIEELRDSNPHPWTRVFKGIMNT